MNVAFKAFIRFVVQLMHDSQNDEDLDNVNIIHKYRFFVYSVMDILNGGSILFAFYCMGISNLKHKKSKMNPSSVNDSVLAEDEDPLESRDKSCNTVKLKLILAGNYDASKKSVKPK